MTSAVNHSHPSLIWQKLPMCHEYTQLEQTWAWLVVALHMHACPLYNLRPTPVFSFLPWIMLQPGFCFFVSQNHTKVQDAGQAMSSCYACTCCSRQALLNQCLLHRISCCSICPSLHLIKWKLYKTWQGTIEYCHPTLQHKL